MIGGVTKVPKLRFPGFAEKWVLKTLQSVSSQIMYGIGSQAVAYDGKNKYLRITDIDDISRKFKPSPLTSPDGLIEKKYQLTQSDIVFARTGASVGKSYLYKEQDGRLVFAGFLIKFHISKADPYFVFLHTQREYYKNWVKVMSMRSGQPGINAEEYKKLVLSFPSLLEQQKIVAFLSAIDRRIEQLSEKLELLEQYKKGMMQKIFSQKIRFRREDGSSFPKWEDYTLGEVAKFRRGSFPQPYGNQEWYDEKNGMPFVQVYDVNDNMKLKSTTKSKISALAQKSSIFVPKGNIVLTIQGSIGRVALTQYDAYVDRTLLIFTDFIKKINKYYFIYLIYLLFEIEKRKAPGGTIKTITKEVLTSFVLKLPCINEQTKIAAFLSAIDRRIDLVQTELDHTKTFKQGLLQQMFI